jgi:hypothetical protein
MRGTYLQRKERSRQSAGLMESTILPSRYVSRRHSLIFVFLVLFYSFFCYYVCSVLMHSLLCTMRSALYPTRSNYGQRLAKTTRRREKTIRMKGCDSFLHLLLPHRTYV